MTGEQPPAASPTASGAAPASGAPQPLAKRVYGRIRRTLGKGHRAVAGVVPSRYAGGVPRPVLNQWRAELARRRTFGPDDLVQFEKLLRSADEVVTMREGFALQHNPPARLIALRHDMDHDLENSLRLARWEAARGIRATYFVLHTDWYHHDARTGQPSKFMLSAMHRIAALGHEIALHNNCVAAALLTGRDPAEILAEELDGLRRNGFDVVGSVAHGDKLCRELHFVNSEMFTEVPRPKLGAPDRTIDYVNPAAGRRTSLTLKPVPMAVFGLTYEGNLVGHNMYLSDTGGRWSQPFALAERRLADDGGYLQIMTHPVWWAIRGEPFRPRAAIPARPAGPADPAEHG